MNMARGGAEFAIASDDTVVGEFTLPSLAFTGPGGHWVEFSRPICAGRPAKETLEAMDAYHEYYDAARATMRAGATAHDVHRAVSKGFVDRGFGQHVVRHTLELRARPKVLCSVSPTTGLWDMRSVA